MSKNNYVHIYANICPIKTWEFLYASTQDFVSEKYVPFAGITLKEGYLLTGSDSYVEPRTMQNHFKYVLTAAQVETTNFHTLRHTFATRCVEAGFDIKSLSEILGHSNVNITMNRYVHPTMELKRQNMQRLSCPFPSNFVE